MSRILRLRLFNPSLTGANYATTTYIRRDAVVTIIGSRAQHPAWIAFLIITALVWMGTR